MEVEEKKVRRVEETEVEQLGDLREYKRVALETVAEDNISNLKIHSCIETELSLCNINKGQCGPAMPPYMISKSSVRIYG